MIKIERLYHCGIMPNYECSAACRHCLYACSPARNEGYMNREQAEKVCRDLRAGNCRSVHIGGGEPFLDFDGLLTLLAVLQKFDIAVDYIETNASWAENEADVERKLSELKKAGADTLCISLDPYHAEFIPYGLPLRLAQVCREVGFGYFIWKEQFYRVLKNADSTKALSRSELEAKLGCDYIYETAKAYGLRPGGRATNIFRKNSKLYPLETLLKKASPSAKCEGLLDTNHFHVDLFGRFIPPGCTGYAIPLDELLEGLKPGKYPAFEASLTGGSVKLFELASKNGFVPDSDGYVSRCEACFFMRKFLSQKEGFPELDAEFFIHSEEYPN